MEVRKAVFQFLNRLFFANFGLNYNQLNIA